MTRLREVSLFCWSVEQNARDTQMTTRVTEGARREISSRASAPVSRVSCNPVTKSEEKGRLRAFYWWPAMSTIGESQAISHSNDIGQQAQQVVGNPRFSTETSLEKANLNSSRTEKTTTTRSRAQSTENIAQYSEGNVVNTATTNMYRGSHKIRQLHCKWSLGSLGENTDCRRFKKWWGDQATLTVYSKIIFFDATIGSNGYTICTMHVKNSFPTDWGQPISLYTINRGRISSVGRTLDCRRGGRGFNSRGRTNTQGLKINWEMKVPYLFE